MSPDAAILAEKLEATSCQLRNIEGRLWQAANVIRLQQVQLRKAGILPPPRPVWNCCSSEAA